MVMTMKSLFKLIAEIILVFFAVNIAQDIVHLVIHKIQEPYIMQLEEVEQELEELNMMLENVVIEEQTHSIPHTSH